jgi:hypothetical protein
MDRVAEASYTTARLVRLGLCCGMSRDHECLVAESLAGGLSAEWSSGHGSWLEIQRSGFDTRRYRISLRSSGSGTASTRPRECN